MKTNEKIAQALFEASRRRAQDLERVDPRVAGMPRRWNALDPISRELWRAAAKQAVAELAPAQPGEQHGS